jgi:hypothetical protein
MFIFSPLPTLQIYPLFKVFSPARILCQVKDAPAFGPALRISPLG